jgi:hypothetical protein
MPDRKLAAHLGRTLFSVQNRRLKRGIPPASNPAYRPWSAREIGLIGTMPDSDVARMIGRRYEAVRDKRGALEIPYRNPRYDWWTREELKLLEKLPDDEVSKRTGRSLHAVKLKRFKMRKRR